MSMICRVLGLTPAQMDVLRATPSLVSRLVRVAEDDHHTRRFDFDELLKHMSPERRKQFEANRAMLEAVAKKAEVQMAEARERIAPLGPFEPSLSLEKSWHMLHYLFTGHVGTSSAPGDLLMTGEEMGDDVGYGPARLHGPAETRDFSRFLETQDLARLQARVNLQEMNRLRIYAIPFGPGSDAEYGNELRNEVGLYFPRLRDYAREMSDKGNGLLTWVS
jgi:uncharacterized protein DUF1877